MSIRIIPKFKAHHIKKGLLCDVLLICFVNKYVDVLPYIRETQESWEFKDINLFQWCSFDLCYKKL